MLWEEWLQIGVIALVVWGGLIITFLIVKANLNSRGSRSDDALREVEEERQMELRAAMGRRKAAKKAAQVSGDSLGGDDSKVSGSFNVPPEIKRSIEVKVTERTREDIDTMFQQVSSLTQELKRPDFANQQITENQRQALEESGVVKAIADTMVSEVSTNEIEKQKFSKMSLDASLFFDESDVGFFEKEFGADPKKE